MQTIFVNNFGDFYCELQLLSNEHTSQKYVLTGLKTTTYRYVRIFF